MDEQYSVRVRLPPLHLVPERKQIRQMSKSITHTLQLGRDIFSYHSLKFWASRRDNTYRRYQSPWPRLHLASLEEPQLYYNILCVVLTRGSTLVLADVVTRAAVRQSFRSEFSGSGHIPPERASCSILKAWLGRDHSDTVSVHTAHRRRSCIYHDFVAYVKHVMLRVAHDRSQYRDIETLFLEET